MGVGVYSEDFQGTGRTFLVSGALLGQAEYRQYVKQADDPEDVVSYDTWLQQEAEDEVESLQAAVNAVHVSMLDRPMRPGYELKSSTFTSSGDSYGSWTVLAEVGPYSVALRSWQHDYVIGVAPTDEDQGVAIFCDGAERRRDALEQFGAPLEVVRDRAAALRDALDEYVRLSVQAEGFECRFPTSGWTTGCYTPMGDEDRDARMKLLGEVIVEARDWFAVGAADRLKASSESAEQRKALLAELRKLEEAGDRVDRRGIWPVVPCVVMEERQGEGRVLVGQVISALTGDVELTRDIAVEGRPEFAALGLTGDVAALTPGDGPLSLDLSVPAERDVACAMLRRCSELWFAVEPAELVSDWPEHAQENWDLSDVPAPAL